MRAGLTVLSLVFALGGCALAPEPRRTPTAAERGHEVARRACAGCHAVEPGGVSPRPRAPAFGSLEMRHTAGLEGRVADLTRLGHYSMPPLRLSPQEVSDLVAYIESLEAPEAGRRGEGGLRARPLSAHPSPHESLT
jgi:mono/diheme cytochrome c family protein